MANTDFEPAVPLDNQEPELNAEPQPTSKAGGAAQAIKDGARQLAGQATDRARGYAEDGKGRGAELLEEFSKLMSDASGSVDEKLGEQYGQYARSAADQLAGFADTLRNKDVDELVGEARDFVKKSPAVAIGAAAAVGFVLARMVKSGLDANSTADNGNRKA